MKSLALSIAFILSLSFSNIYATPADNGDSAKNEKPAAKMRAQKEPAQLDVTPELAILGAELAKSAQEQAARTQQLRNSLKYNTKVLIFDSTGSLVSEFAKGQQPQIPTNADLLLTENGTEYYVVIK